MIKDVEEKLQSDMENIRLKYKIRTYDCVALNSGSVGSHIRGEKFTIEPQLVVDRVTTQQTTLPLSCLVLLGWAQEVSSADFRSPLTCRKEYGIFPAGLAPSAPGKAEQTQTCNYNQSHPISEWGPCPQSIKGKTTLLLWICLTT